MMFNFKFKGSHILSGENRAKLGLFYVDWDTTYTIYPFRKAGCV